MLKIGKPTHLLLEVRWGPCLAIAFKGKQCRFEFKVETRSSWSNCVLRDDEAVSWVSIGHYEAVAVGN